MSSKSSSKKRKSHSKKEQPKKLAVRFSSPQISPTEPPTSRGTRAKTLRSENNDYISKDVDPSSRELSPEPTLHPSKIDRSKSVGNVHERLPHHNDDITEFKLDKPGRTKSSKSVVDYSPDYKKRYETVNTKNHELNRKINEYEWQISNLNNELKKNNKGRGDGDQQNVKYERAIKNKEKEIQNLRRRLKLAITDYEKVHGYYQKQLELFKKNQQKWLHEQRSNGRDVTKYVFADDIKKVKVRKKGLRVYFVDGEDVVFENIEVIGGADDNDDDQYRNLVKRVKEEPDNEKDKKSIIELLEDDDMIILCLNELNARIRDFKHRNDDNYAPKIQERYQQLPIYHIEDTLLKQLKTNNSHWIKLFRGRRSSKNGGNKGRTLGAAFFSAQKEIKSGIQPTICVQNNVILNNMNQHSKRQDVSFSTHLQDKIDAVHAKANKTRMDKQSVNIETDEDLQGLPAVSIGNGWFTAQIEMTNYNQQPSVCIKNNISLKHLQKKKGKYKVKRKMKAKMLQKRLDEQRKRTIGHSTRIAMDKGDSSEEDEDGNDIYNMSKNGQYHKEKEKNIHVTSIMSGWFSSQIDIAKSKQPTICVQNNVFLNNLDSTKEQIESNNDRGKKQSRKSGKNKKLTGASLQKKLNLTTSPKGLSENAFDLSDDEYGDDDAPAYDDIKLNDISHEDMWYYKNGERKKWIKGITVGKERSELLLEIATYLNRLLPRSPDHDLIKHYLPIFNNVYDIMAALFDGVLISVLLNFLDPDLIDLRALNLCENKYPISKEHVIENIFVIKASITAIDLHEFPNFDIDFAPHKHDEEVLSWYNPHKFVDILLLIIMHQFSGLLNKKVNAHAYPELFRLCQNRTEKKSAQKTAAKEWLHRWITFMKNPVMNKQGTFLSIDLAGYHSPVTSGNISWESIKILPQSGATDDEEEDSKVNYTQELIYVWNTDRREMCSDILQIHSKLNIDISHIPNTIALRSDVVRSTDNNYLMQLVYLADLFVFNNCISSLSSSERQHVHDYLHKKASLDNQVIAWINSFKVIDGDGAYQYVDNLADDISDGTIILHLLDAVKPGCVDWKNSGIRTGNDVRHKFDKLTNCQMVKRVCDESFRDIFHLVGFGGNDIVDENGKYIRSLLLQIQRHHSMELMAKILFKKKAVSDDELLKWMNNRLRVYKQMVAAMNKMHRKSKDETFAAAVMKASVGIKSFEDRDALSDALNFCNVISSINPQWINYQYVYDEMQCKKEKSKQIENARYLITTLRRLGTDTVFTTPSELVQCKSSATISISTAIMTIAARYREYDQLALFAKNLMQIKAKMQKK